MKKLLFLCLVLPFLAACNDESNRPENLRARQLARQKIFVQCMELAAKNKRNSDDKVSKIVEECDSVAYYQTVFVRAEK